MFTRAIKIFSILILLSFVIAALDTRQSSTVAFEAAETVQNVAQPLSSASQCSGGLQYDSFQYESLTATDVRPESPTEATDYYFPRVQKFTPPFYPYEVNTICVCWYSDYYGQIVTNRYRLSVYEDDGNDGGPGSEIFEQIVARSTVWGEFHEDHYEWVPYPVNLTIESGSIYVGGVTVNNVGNPRVCSGESNAVPPPVVFYRVQMGDWRREAIRPGMTNPDALGIRLIGPYTGLLDGRLNTDPAQQAAVYCNSEYVDVYAIGDNSEGYLAFRVTWDDINALGIPDDDPILIAETEDGIRLYRLTTGELQVNAPTYDAINGYDYNGYSFTWSGCEAPE